MSDETRDRVKRAAAELGYRPARAARSLRKGHNARVVAFILHGFRTGQTDLEVAQMWRRINDVMINDLSQHSVSFVSIPAEQLELLADNAFDAVMVVYPPDAAAALPKEIPTGCPVIVLSYDPSLSELPGADGFILVRMLAAFHETFDHLRDSGASQPALLYDELPLMAVSAFTSGYSTWCRANQVSEIAFNSINRETVREAIAQGADAFLIKGSDIDRSAERVVEYLNEMGLSVPGDVLLVSQSEDLSEPALGITCLSWLGRDIGLLISQFLRDGLQAGKFGSIELPYELRVRESSLRIP